MLTYGFYNSVNGDRTYSAEQLASIFEGMIHDGVFEDIGDKLLVEATTGMDIKVGTGRAWFNQTWTKNDSDIVLTVAAAEVVLNRIDTVVLEVDASVEARTNSIKIVKGTPGENPVAPTLTNTTDVHQYPLANIYIGASVVEIISNNITNKVGTVDCPYVTGVLKNVDTDTVDSILEAFEALETEFDTNIGPVLNQSKTITTTGSANAYVVTYGENIPESYTDFTGMIKASFSNTGSATVNVNTLGAKTMKKVDSTGLVNLATGDIIEGGIYTIHYDGTYIIVDNPSSIYASLLTARGMIIRASGPNAPEALALGTSGKALVSNGTDVVYDYPSIPKYAASNNVVLTSATEVSHYGGVGTDNVWYTLKYFTIKRDGTVRVKCQAKAVDASGANISINDTAPTTQTVWSNYNNYQWDIDVVAGGTYLIRLKSTSNFSTLYVKDLTVSFDQYVPSDSIT